MVFFAPYFFAILLHDYKDIWYVDTFYSCLCSPCTSGKHSWIHDFIIDDNPVLPDRICPLPCYYEDVGELYYVLLVHVVLAITHFML